MLLRAVSRRTATGSSQVTDLSVERLEEEVASVTESC